ncbi:hypothetical protein GCM10022276_09160 [Sphingomonas limnosediminicola]|uniref:Uncharacterized protein n=1 Tax=Sphingomonas limnosediminicola TaxID=940133 RepID=A0ABP7L133_9SPHN
MTSFTRLLAAAAAVGSLSAPLAAQSAYGYQPQVYPQQQTYPQQAYPQQGYAYGQQQGYAYGQPGYGQQGYAQSPVTQIIDQLLGNRYNVTDRQAVSRCASAAMNQASAQYGAVDPRYTQQYGQQGYNNRYAAMRVSSITNVQRRQNGLRVTGVLSSGAHHGQYGGQYGYQNRDYARADVSFRCNVDYRGQVTNVRIGNNYGYNR